MHEVAIITPKSFSAQRARSSTMTSSAVVVEVVTHALVIVLVVVRALVIRACSVAIVIAMSCAILGMLLFVVLATAFLIRTRRWL